jgi:hypothetical protein
MGDLEVDTEDNIQHRDGADGNSCRPFTTYYLIKDRYVIFVWGSFSKATTQAVAVDLARARFTLVMILLSACLKSTHGCRDTIIVDHQQLFHMALLTSRC